MSMTPEQTKKFNIGFGTIFMVGALLTWGMAVYFSVAPAAPKPIIPTNGTVVKLSSCKNTLEQMGYSTKVENKMLTAFKGFSVSESATVESDVNLMTAASLACKYEIAYMCLGTGCAEGAMTIKLNIPDGASAP